MKILVNSKTKIFLRSNNNGDLGLDLNRVFYIRICMCSIFMLGQVQPQKSTFTVDVWDLPLPLESGEIVVARAKDRVRFPARFQLVAAFVGETADQGFRSQC